MKKILLFFISLAFSVISFSQNKTGQGNVSDNAGVLISNAIVHITPATDTTLVYEYVCDKNGNFSFDITSNDSDYLINIFPSAQTLQFTFDEENMPLSVGDNGMRFYKVKPTNTKGIRFTVVDTSGNPVSGARVLMYDTERKWRIDSCSVAKPFYTDINGHVLINSLLPVKYWFNVRKDYMTNRFTIKNTGTAIDTNTITNIKDTIRDLSQKELYMCGPCDNKTWITDSMVIFGVSQPYNADSKLLSDGTWSDSNGNHGYWWFSVDETRMTYNYDTTSPNGGGSTIEATLIKLTDSTFSGDMTMFGLPVTYYMSARYDTVNLNLTAQDTTINLDNNGEAHISPDDLNIVSGYCFASGITLSQSDFDMNDIGNVEVYVTLEDRCGNRVTDTITITIGQSLAVNDNFKSYFNIFPIPANDYVVIESSERIENIDMYNMLGIKVKQFAINKEQYIIDTSDLIHGLYLIRIATANGVIVKKLIVK